MNPVRRVPLAWKNLAHDRVRFALFAAGIGFAVVLMGVQLGIMNAMLDGNTALIKRLNGELVLVNPNKASLLFREAVSRRRMEQAAGVSGVRSAYPVYLEYQLGMLRDTAADPAARTQTRRVRVVGIEPGSGVLDLPEVSPDEWAKLNTPGTALYDRQSRKDPLRPGQTVFGKLEPGTTTELAGKDVTLVGGFDLGFDFACDGTLVVSDRTFSRALRQPYYPVSPMAEVDVVVVKLEPGADAEDVRARLREVLGNQGDVEVLTRDELVSRERAFWQRNTPIGFAFGAGVVLGFVVGMVICYQILASDVADHVSEYATLKAIGYPNRYLSLVVLQESLVLAAAGFVPGMAVILGVYVILTEWTGLPMRLTPGRFALVLGLTLVMCVLSGLMALRKAQKVDPADVF
jgi:putative ABC transport system permease protein